MTDSSLNRVAFLSDGVAGEVALWLDQCKNEESARDSMFLPAPMHLAALASYAEALVLQDGLVLTNGPEYHRRTVPDWGYVGYCNAYDAIEEILCQTPDGLTDAVASTTPDEIGHIHAELSNPGRLVYPPMVDLWISTANYLAWECYINHGQPRIRPASPLGSPAAYKSAIFVLDTGYILARSALEDARQTVGDLLQHPYGEVISGFGEVQLPLILGAAVSKIDSPDQLLEELLEMRNKAAKVRERLLELEMSIVDPTALGSGRKIRLLREDLAGAIRKAAAENTSPSTHLQQVAGLANQDVGSILSTCMNLIKHFRQPELRLISRWTRTTAYSTIGKLRKLFRTTGDDAEWETAARFLQLHGSVAWYPSRGRT